MEMRIIRIVCLLASVAIVGSSCDRRPSRMGALALQADSLLPSKASQQCEKTMDARWATEGLLTLCSRRQGDTTVWVLAGDTSHQVLEAGESWVTTPARLAALRQQIKSSVSDVRGMGEVLFDEDQNQSYQWLAFGYYIRLFSDSIRSRVALTHTLGKPQYGSPCRNGSLSCTGFRRHHP